MSIFFSVFIVIVCILLILIVLVQNSKGGGLASNFASSNQFMGVRKTADFLEKATWTLAGTLLFLCLLTSITQKSSDNTPKSALDEGAKNIPVNAVQHFPTPVTNPTNQAAPAAPQKGNAPAPANGNKK